jgi:hypothetical protein
VISDLHFDPFFDQSLFPRLVAEPIERWVSILENSQPPGLNPRHTDSNFALVDSALGAAAAALSSPDFILYPGDFLAHEWQSKYDAVSPRSHLNDPDAYRVFTTKVIAFLVERFRTHFPKTLVLPTLGNDDSFCGDYAITPDGPFLRMFAEVWSPLFPTEAHRRAFRETFSRGGYYTLILPANPRHRLIVLNSVPFSVSYDNTCGSAVQTPALDELDWFEEKLHESRVRGEKVWLLTHIPPGINAYNSVDPVSREETPITFWQPELTSRFLQILGGSPLPIGFAGHTHMDDYRVIRLRETPALFLKIAPAISPIFGNNPGFHIVEYDQVSGSILNFETHYLTNLETGGKPTRPADAHWEREYDFRSAYPDTTLDAESVASLADSLKTDTTLQDRYTRFYSVSAAPEFSPSTFPIYRAVIANVTPAEFLRSATGKMKPRSPHPHPDRRRMLVAKP